MTLRMPGIQAHVRSLVRKAAAISLGALAGALFASAGEISFGDTHFWPGNLVVSRSVYDNNPDNVIVGTILPPNCGNTTGGCAGPGGATNNGSYPEVFNNAIYDGSFGITSRIFLDQITPTGWLIDTLEVPNNLQPWVKSTDDHLVTSFSSKSELALHLSTDGRYLIFSGYVAPVNAIDVSNSNTPGAIDLTNPVGESYYRAIARVGHDGHFKFTETNAYSGNNGRSAVWNNSNGDSLFYEAGNAGNGGTPQPDGIILGAGAQVITPSDDHESDQNPGTPTPVGSFSVTLLGNKPDKIGKDDNFRGIAVFNNVLYYSKGSGGNGVNTVYFVDTTGSACPNGVGLPAPSATLPTSPLAYNPADLQTTGLPSNMCILAGFPTLLAKSTTGVSYPFGIWFADAKTLYIADEGDGYAGGSDLYTHAAAQTTAGLQKWMFDSSSKTWKLAYTLQTGLKLGVPRTVRGYPTGLNSATNLPWAPANDGLRNITGLVDGDRVIVWGITSTVSGSGDQGADPNELVVIEDSLHNSDSGDAAKEKFHTLRGAQFGEVLRGVSFTPGSNTDCK